MFEKRKVLSFRYSDALALLKEDENRLKILIEKEIITPKRKLCGTGCPIP